MDSRGDLMRAAATLLPATYWFCIATTLSLAGCQKSSVATFPVSGRVVFDDGQPVPFGFVELRAERGGQIARGKLDQLGRFELGTFSAEDGVVAGRHQAIVVQHLNPDASAAPRPPQASVSAGHADHQTALVAPAFGSYETSGLEVEVKPNAKNLVTFTVQRFSPRQNRRRP